MHDSPRRITSGFLFPFVQNEKSARREDRRRREEEADREAHREQATAAAAAYMDARATVLNGIIAIKVVAFPRGRRVRAPASYRRRTNDLN